MFATRPLALVALTLSAALAALAVPAGAGALVIGVADQTPAMFADARFQALGITHARLSVPWDALENRRERAALNRWLTAAHADGVSPLISFDHSNSNRRHRPLPSPAAFARQFRRLRALYPWVSDFAAWNEANYCGQTTCHHPALVASYYQQMRRACPRCELLGAELLDVPGMTRWVALFRHALHGGEPAIWGLHDYIGANRLQTASTRALLRATRAPIWLTETGGVVSRHNHSSHEFPESAAHAAIVTRFLFTHMVRLSPRIARIYIYQWNGGGPRASWDSGLLAPNGRARPAYAVFVQELRALGGPPAALPLAPAAG
jgi:hypothetical protein